MVVLVYRNIDALASWDLAWNDSTGFTQTFDTDIVAGDLLFFVMKIGSFELCAKSFPIIIKRYLRKIILIGSTPKKLEIRLVM